MQNKTKTNTVTVIGEISGTGGLADFIQNKVVVDKFDLLNETQNQDKEHQGSGLYDRLGFTKVVKRCNKRN